MNTPLHGKTVLLPRGGDWAVTASAEVHRRGAEAVVAPLITFAPPEDSAPVDAALTRLSEGYYDWLVVTSPRTVAAIADAEIPPSTRIAAVGQSTSNTLLRSGRPVAFQPTQEQSARGLVRQWPDAAAKRILLPRSSLAEPTINEGLGNLGMAVDDPIAYRTVSVDLRPETLARIRAGEVTYVFLTSGSTVREFARQVGVDAPVSIVTIGPITTRDATRAGLPVAYEAATPSIPSMLDAVAEERRPR